MSYIEHYMYIVHTIPFRWAFDSSNVGDLKTVFFSGMYIFQCLRSPVVKFKNNFSLKHSRVTYKKNTGLKHRIDFHKCRNLFDWQAKNRIFLFENSEYHTFFRKRLKEREIMEENEGERDKGGD